MHFAKSPSHIGWDKAYRKCVKYNQNSKMVLEPMKYSLGHLGNTPDL